MRTKLLTSFLAVLSLLSPAAGPRAQAQPARMGLFFDAAGSQWSLTGVQAFTPLSLYAVAFDVPGMTGYEFAFTPPPNLLVTGPSQLHPAAAYENGPGDTNWIVGLAECVAGAGPIPLMGTTVLFVAPPPSDTVIALTGSTPSSTPGGGPGYTDCASGHVAFTFTTGPANDGSAIINASDPCPGLPSETYYHLAAADVQGAASQVAVLPISAHTQYIFKAQPPAKCTIVWPILVEVSFALEWDSAVAAFDHIALTPGAPAFALTANPVAPGRVEVILQTIGTAEPPTTATPWLQLGLLATGENSSTAVNIVELQTTAYIWDPAYPFVANSVAHAGSLTVGPVPNDTQSWGGLKARFDDDR